MVEMLALASKDPGWLTCYNQSVEQQSREE